MNTLRPEASLLDFELCKSLQISAMGFGVSVSVSVPWSISARGATAGLGDIGRRACFASRESRFALSPRAFDSTCWTRSARLAAPSEVGFTG